MKKFINSPDSLLVESLRGFALAHNDIIEFCEENRFIKRKTNAQKKVVLISGGGSGHEPL